ncbi:hypothetical protein ACI2JA_04005 [Alkalihalobacillus sp. NPDC078783]
MKSIQVEIDEFVEENDLYTQGYSSVFSDKDGHPAKVMVKVNGELDVERQYFVNNTYNRLKFVDNEWHFLRFDDIKRDHDPFYSDTDVNKVYSEIVMKLDYELKYAKDRVALVSTLVDGCSDWIYNLLSDTRIIAKEHKKKNSFLAEDQKPDSTFALVVDYISHAKYIDEEHEKSILLAKEKVKKESKNINILIEDEINTIASQIQDWNRYSVREDLKRKGKDNLQVGKDSRVEWVGHLEQLEEDKNFKNRLIRTEEIVHREQKKRKHFAFENPDPEYWKHFFPSERKALIPWLDEDIHNEEKNKSVLGRKFREETYDTAKETVDMYAKKLGYGIKDSAKRKKYQEQLIRDIGRKQYSLIKRTYNDLKYDLKNTRDSLTCVFEFKGSNTTHYSLSEDTWYEDENGEGVELSKNHVTLDNPNTYKGILLEYKNLKKKYDDKFTSEFWALLRVFEDVYSKTEFTEEEKFVTGLLINDYTQTEIRDFLDTSPLLSSIGRQRLSNMINKSIPNKLMNTYLDSVDEWIYTYKLKGKYKRCKRCEEIKLISNDRYFSVKKDAKDGFKTVCKKCLNKQTVQKA